jgi:ribonuclease J
MTTSPVKLVFLGGLGEIGRNCFCLEVEGRILVVDCGIMFPEVDMPGIDLVLPDFTYLRENADRVEAVFLTHAHEDHAGALAYLLRDVPVPIYGSPLSLGLARNRIEEAGKLGRTELIPVHDGERREIGPFDCEFIPVTHSVPTRSRPRTTRRGHDPPQRRLQARPHAGRRPPHRPLADGAIAEQVGA